MSWFTGLALHANQATGYTAFFENGAFAQAGVVVWRPLNLFDATEITIPVGSELLMGAWTGEGDESALEFTIEGDILGHPRPMPPLPHSGVLLTAYR